MSKDRTIIITGVTRGLGLALAHELAHLGHTVLGCGRSSEAIAELRQTLPAPHDFEALDVADSAAVEAWVQRLVTDHPTPDLVINNAALMNEPAPLWEVSAADFGQLMDVNVDGTVNVIRAVVPPMIAAGRGVIVNISSGYGKSTGPEVAPYCASKFAIEGLTNALAQELPNGLAVVAVSPGVIDTAMLRKCWGDGAVGQQTAESWGPKAAAFFLALDASNNGDSLRIG